MSENKNIVKMNGKYKNNFNELCSIGCGGFSTVFKCEEKCDHKLYAIKKVFFELENEIKLTKEIQFLLHLNRNLFVCCYDYWIESNYNLDNRFNEQQNISTNNISSSSYPYILHILMELCPLTLRDVINIIVDKCINKDDNTLSLTGYYLASELLYEILECVQYLHKQIPAIIHRDLKPENILLTNFVNNRFVKLCDFGLSTFHEFDNQSHTGNIGTSRYRAYEITDNSKYTTKADIYSLGIILQELFRLNMNEKVSSDLEPKLLYLMKLYQNQISYYSELRPNCDKVLSEKHLWLLSNNQLEKDKSFQKILHNSQKINSIEENFLEFFVQNKYNINNSLSVRNDSFQYKYNSKFSEVCSLGPYSTVFKAIKRNDNKLYAIKKICFRPEDELIVTKELKILSEYNSEYIVKYYDSWIEPNYYIGLILDNNLQNLTSPLLVNSENTLLLHIQMELCPLTLRDVLTKLNNERFINDKKSLSVIRYYIVSELLFEMLECVQYLHEQSPKIIHRDLKPENILLTNFVNNRFVKLSDFGLSTFHEFSDQSHSLFTGTKSYRAVELNFSSKYSTKADIYSIGIIIQELFNIDLNDENKNYIPILKPKMIYLKELILKQLSSIQEKRPNCDEVLSENYLWRLSEKEIHSDQEINQILTNSTKVNSINENFIYFFVQNSYEKIQKINPRNNSFFSRLFSKILN